MHSKYLIILVVVQIKGYLRKSDHGKEKKNYFPRAMDKPSTLQVAHGGNLIVLARPSNLDFNGIPLQYYIRVY